MNTADFLGRFLSLVSEHPVLERLFFASVEFAARCAAGDIELWLIKSGDHRLNGEKERMAFAACEFMQKLCQRQ